MKKKDLFSGAIGLALVLIASAGIGGWYINRKQLDELKSQLSELQRQEKRSAVLQSINAQMEEIAVQQKEISD